jgi:predicted Fe-Mo cluster-binding NifX family protein
MRIFVPLKDNNGLNSRVTGHPGRAPFYAIVEIDVDKIVSYQIYENQHAKEENEEHEHHGHHEHGRHGGAFLRVILDKKPDVFITYIMGPGVFNALKQMGVKIYLPKGHTLQESVEGLLKGELKEMREPIIED